MDLKILVRVAEDLNVTFGLDPQIKTNGVTEKMLMDQLREASEGITEDTMVEDEIDLQPYTVKILKELGMWPMVEEVVDMEEEDEIEEKEGLEEEEEEGEDAYFEPDDTLDDVEEKTKEVRLLYNRLVKKIRASDKLAADKKLLILKTLVREEPLFNAMVKRIGGRFDTDDIKREMLEILSKNKTLLVPSEVLGKSEVEEDEVVEEMVEEVEEVVEEEIEEVVEKKVGRGRKKSEKVEKVEKVKKEKAKKELPKEKVPKVVSKVSVGKAELAVRPKKSLAYARVDAVCEALKRKPTTMDEWVEWSDDLMVEHGQKKNPLQNRWIIRYMLQMERHFSFPKMPTT